jgi:hypothetical protein
MAVTEREGNFTELVDGPVSVMIEHEGEMAPALGTPGGEVFEVADAEAFTAPEAGADIMESAAPDLDAVEDVAMEVS